MNSRTLMPRPLVWILALAALVTATASAQQTGPESVIPPDDPHGRAAFEYDRLADPATGVIPPGIRSRELEYARTLPSRDPRTMLKSAGTEGVTTQQWTFRGPESIGGRSRALGIDISNPDLLLAGGVSGGMWRSFDAGMSWVRVTPLDELQSVSCIAQDTRSGKTNIWYYGTGEYFGNSASADGASYMGNGVFKSTDAGTTWFHLESTGLDGIKDFGRFRYVWRIAVDASRSDSDVVYAATTGGIYRSNNGGTEWQLVLGGAGNWSVATDLAISSQGILYATLSSRAMTPSGGGSGSVASVKGIFRSVDGWTWTDIGAGHFPATTNRIVLGIAPSDENVVYFLGETPGSNFESPDPLGRMENHSFFKYTYLSGDGTAEGGTWANRSSSLPFYMFLGPFSSQGSYDLVVKVKPDDPDFVVIGGTNLYRSKNGFQNTTQSAWIGGYNPDYDPSGANLLIWMNLAYTLHHPDIHDVVFHPAEPNTMYTADDGGIHRTLDCRPAIVNWRPMNNGFVTSQFYAISINPDKAGDHTIVGGMQDNSTYASRGKGQPWSWLAGGDGGYCAIRPDLDNTFYVMTQYGGFYRTETDPDLYVDDVTSLSISGVSRFSFPFIAPMELDPNAPTCVFIAGLDRIWRNPLLDDQYVGLQWQSMDGTTPSSGYISAIEVAPKPSSVLYFGSTRGRLYKLVDPVNTMNPPEQITSTSFPLPSSISCIASDPENGDNLMVVFSNYSVRSLFYTSDGGTNWTDVSGNLEENPNGSGNGPSCRWADVVRVGNQTIWFVGTSTGLYSTTQLNGQSTVWVQEGANSIGNAIVTMVRTRQSDGFVAVGTHGNGVFSTNAVPVSVAGSPAPADFYLEQNFPNPASGTTAVRYSVPSSESFSLKLHDALGRAVRVLHTGASTPGQHEAVIALDDLPAGNYFLRLSGSGFAQTRMVTITR